jgi:hypothetical protein
MSEFYFICPHPCSRYDDCSHRKKHTLHEDGSCRRDCRRDGIKEVGQCVQIESQSMPFKIEIVEAN